MILPPRWRRGTALPQPRRPAFAGTGPDTERRPPTPTGPPAPAPGGCGRPWNYRVADTGATAVGVAVTSR